MPPSLDRVDRAHAASCVRRDDQTNQLQDRYVVGDSEVVGFVVVVVVVVAVGPSETVGSTGMVFVTVTVIVV
jgi:hypothetical protein